MYKDILKELGTVDIYGILSLVIFAAVFLGAIIYAMTLRKDYVEEMSDLPLKGEDE